MGGIKRVTIDWSYPMEIDRILTDARMDDVGLYYITRVFRGKESDLYIGKATYSFKSRLEDHKWYWLDSYRGKKLVRLGYLTLPEKVSDKEKKKIINDAEMQLIYIMGDSLRANVQCVNSCNPSQFFIIKNIGFRGNLAAEMYISDDEWLA